MADKPAEPTTETVETTTETATEPKQPEWHAALPKDLPKSVIRETLEETLQALNNRSKHFESKVRTEPKDFEIGGNDSDDLIDGIDAAIEKAGLDYAELVKTVREKGDLTDEQYGKIQKATKWGRTFTKNIVNGEIQKHDSKVSALRSAAEEAAGGPEAWAELYAKANSTLTAEQVRFFNKVAADPETTPEDMADAVRLLRTKLGDKAPPKRIDATATSTGGDRLEGFGDREEYRKAAKQLADLRSKNKPVPDELRMRIFKTSDKIKRGI